MSIADIIRKPPEAPVRDAAAVVVATMNRLQADRKAEARRLAQEAIERQAK